MQDLKATLREMPVALPANGALALVRREAARHFSAAMLTPGHFSEMAAHAGLATGLLPPDQRTCHPVRNQEDLKTVKKKMLKNLTKPSDGWVSRHLNRPISTSVSRVLAYTPLLPNHITFITGLIAFIPCYFMWKGGYWNWLAAAAIYHLASVLDGVDGEIARLKMKSSQFGQWLDTMFDFVSMVAVLIALVIGVHRTEQPAIYRWAGLLAMVFAVLSLVSLTWYAQRAKKGGSFNIAYNFQNGTSRWDRLLQSAAILGRRDFYIFLFLIMAVLGLMPWALLYVGVLAVFVFVFSVQAHLTLKR